ncbi:MAG: ABC transporter permease [Oscillospiraceae bacterium]|jgi:ABC-type transport system involved in multi-copper enzyme maturation permease subunit|nr:ABC transporter permease [Oscillospiraceae bacterium]
MFNYIKGEIYRLLNKKSMYIFFGIFAAVYILFALVNSRMGDGYNSKSIIDHAYELFMFLPVVLGGYLFGSLYNDDLTSKNLTTLVGYGLSKLKIVLSKLVLITLFSAVVFGLIPLVMTAVFAILGAAPTAAALGTVYIKAFVALLTTVAFSALTGIVVYGLQRKTFAMVLYVLLSFGIISQLISMLLNSDIIRGIAPNLDKHLMTGITDRIEQGLTSGQPVILIFIEYIIYVAVALTLSVLAFHKKELEF